MVDVKFDKDLEQTFVDTIVAGGGATSNDFDMNRLNRLTLYGDVASGTVEVILRSGPREKQVAPAQTFTADFNLNVDANGQIRVVATDRAKVVGVHTSQKRT